MSTPESVQSMVGGLERNETGSNGAPFFVLLWDGGRKRARHRHRHKAHRYRLRHRHGHKARPKWCPKNNDTMDLRIEGSKPNPIIAQARRTTAGSQNPPDSTRLKSRPNPAPQSPQVRDGRRIRPLTRREKEGFGRRKKSRSERTSRLGHRDAAYWPPVALALCRLHG